ncbi:flagellar hook-basal body complex protein FliE [Paenirhodobacter enshiensis]|uniref:flagellar hook-basal body complex protein FliE n=1 Tax=Paenirhodobacter enshiensis TaxID=1105367 RepID=UPI0035B069C9
MDIRSSTATQGYLLGRSAASPAPDTGTSSVGSVAKSFEDTLRNGEETARASMFGQADPHALVQALAQTELAVETAVTVRDKVVEAYQEILRMPV